MKAYGVNWHGLSAIEIELELIRAGGVYRDGNRSCGHGLFFHYKQLQSLIAPWKKWDRWSELILKNLIENRLTVLTGPANSTKTHNVAFYALCRYLAWPTNQCVLISSTDSRSLELRIWGEIKKLWSAARNVYEDCPGRIVESKQMIVSDVDEDEATDFRNGILGIPTVSGGTFVGLGKFCFPEGSQVDTPSGPRSIEHLQIGDVVLTAIGARKILQTFKRIAHQLIRIRLTDGRCIDCTPNHRILTHLGWVNAHCISTKHRVLSADDTMQILRKADHSNSSEAKILLSEMQVERGSLGNGVLSLRQKDATYDPWQTEILLTGVPNENLGKSVCLVPENFHTDRGESDLLLKILRREMEVQPTWIPGQGDERVGTTSGNDRKENVSDYKSKPERNPTPVKTDERHQPSWTCGSLQREQNPRMLHELQDGCRDRFGSVVSGGYSWPRYSNREKRKAWPSSLLQTGHGLDGVISQRGDRRILPPKTQAENEGQGERSFCYGTRVESVEILKLAGDPRYDGHQGGYRVYNLSVEGHPSYSVNGCIVHNCGIKNGQLFLAADETQFMGGAFYDGISNLSNNPQFQCASMGNPKDRTDVLGKLAEPAASIGGWEGYEPTGKTFCYPTRFPGGKVLCLDGRDTPNNDRNIGEAPPYPYIITPENIAQAVDYYGQDSIQVSMMFYGIFPPDAQAKRVVTRSLCDRFCAFEDPTWTHDSVVKIFAIDAAYGSVGGDRCVGVEMHFGMCSDGLYRLAFAGVPIVIPVTVRNTMLPEEQIATWVKDYCEAPTRNIPPSHVALDSTGRGSLVSAFGRIWTDVNGTPIGTQVVAIEFGGLASDRMVSQKHQVPCRSYYLNFMSELWYDFRHLIESDQCRKLPINVMDEMCMRGWEMTKGNRIQVEPKDKCKLRMGKSPDLADAAVAGLELAKRLGFQVIGKIGLKKSNTPNWLKDLVNKQQQLQKSKQLTYR